MGGALRRAQLACAVTSLAGLAFCTPAAAGGDWVRVARDPNYDISISPGHIRRTFVGSRETEHEAIEVWYKTDHKKPHLHNGKAFNREIVKSILLCDSLWFKVESVDMAMGGAPPISEQRATPDEVDRQPWRRVERGTTEEAAAQAACGFASSRR